MALTINTRLLGETFYSCDLNEIHISTDQPAIQVALNIGSEQVFSSTYFAADGTVVLRDLSSLWETIMFARGLTYTVFILTVQAGDAQVAQPVTIVYCRDRIMNLSARDFLATHFLTTNTSRLTTLHSMEMLSLYKDGPAMPMSIRFNLIVQLPTGELKDTLSYTSQMVGGGTVAQFSFSAKALQEQARLRFADCRLLFFKVTAENRECRFYVQHCPEAQVFHFRNNFNCMEAVSFPAPVTSVLETSYSEAVLNGKLSHYDVRHSRTFQMETPPLLSSQQTWLEQFLTSPMINMLGTSVQRVLIKEYTFEQSEAPGAENTLTFTWLFADGRHTRHSLSLHTGIFTEPFNQTFA